MLFIFGIHFACERPDSSLRFSKGLVYSEFKFLLEAANVTSVVASTIDLIDYIGAEKL